MPQDTSNIEEEPYDPEMYDRLQNQPRRNSIEHPGANHTGDLTQSLLPDKVIKKTLMSDPMYMHAWMDLNIGFLERFKKIKSSFRNRKLNFFEHMGGKKWKNIKKICPPLKYTDFMNNHALVVEANLERWGEINHQYLIREVTNLPKKC